MFQGKHAGLAIGFALIIFTGSASAAINADMVNGGGSLGTGTGAGELFFSIYDDDAKNSLTLDLNVGVQSFLADPLAGVSVQSDALRDFILAGSVNEMVWNVAGLNNDGAGPGFSNLFVLTTVTPGAVVQPFTSDSNLAGALERAGAYLNAVNAQIGAGDSIIANSGDGYWGGGAWANSFDGNLPFTNDVPLIGPTEALMVIMAGTASGGVEVRSHADLAAGFWRVDADSGTVSFGAPVPVPAAIWLFLSGILGLVVRGRGAS
ncbi:MAG: hypothetical protein ACU84Q_19630 [Gammaproteobacteria bacterium]